jgi:hypothetical protein
MKHVFKVSAATRPCVSSTYLITWRFMSSCSRLVIARDSLSNLIPSCRTFSTWSSWLLQSSLPTKTRAAAAQGRPGLSGFALSLAFSYVFVLARSAKCRHGGLTSWGGHGAAPQTQARRTAENRAHFGPGRPPGHPKKEERPRALPQAGAQFALNGWYDVEVEMPTASRSNLLLFQNFKGIHMQQKLW